MADGPTKDKLKDKSMWPDGEPRSVRDAYDKMVRAGKGRGK
jgi:hypothetical protein